MRIWHLLIACWITKAKNIHSEYVLLFHCNNGSKNAPQCYVIRTLAVLFSLAYRNFFNSHIPSIKYRKNVRFRGQSVIIGPQYRNCLISPLYGLQFGEGGANFLENLWVPDIMYACLRTK